MERDSESFLVNAGEYSDENTFDSMFSGISLLSLLGASHQEPILTSPMSPLFGDFPAQATLGFFSDVGASSNIAASLSLRLPKPEPHLGFQAAAAADSSPHADSHVFHQLPDLLSLERVTDESPSPSSFGPLQKRARVDSASQHYHQYPLPPQPRVVPFNNWVPPPTEAPAPASSSSSMMIPRGSALARQRRQKLSDKTRCLQKLLPWDKKMDMATMLEEAYKYVKFLQAQLTALKAMPTISTAVMPPPPPQQKSMSDVNDRRRDLDIGELAGSLARLTRNQLLQVLVNSPVAQTMLYSQGCCVFSAEQLGLVEKVAAMRMRRRRSNVNPLHPNLF